MEFGSVGGQGLAVDPFAHGPEVPPPVPAVPAVPPVPPRPAEPPLPPGLPVPPVPPGDAPPVTIPPVPAWVGVPPLPVPAVEVEPPTPPVTDAVPAVAGVVPAAAFAVPPVVLLPPKPVPALEVEPAKPLSPGSVVLEQATAKTLVTPNQKPVVKKSFGLLCMVADSGEGPQSSAPGQRGIDQARLNGDEGRRWSWIFRCEERGRPLLPMRAAPPIDQTIFRT